MASWELGVMAKIFPRRLPTFFPFWLSQIFLRHLQVPPDLPSPSLGSLQWDSPLKVPGYSCQAYASMDELEGASWPIFPLIQVLLLFLFLLPTASSCSYPFLHPEISLPAQADVSLP